MPQVEWLSQLRSVVVGLLRRVMPQVDWLSPLRSVVVGLLWQGTPQVERLRMWSAPAEPLQQLQAPAVGLGPAGERRKPSAWA
jgi:hypothetical protein